MESKGNNKGTKKVRTRKSPQSETRAVPFRLDAPDATSVALVGDFNGWDPSARKLRRSKTGKWYVTIRLVPGVYQYKFVVNDREWREDTGNPRREVNNYGTMNSICEVI